LTAIIFKQPLVEQINLLCGRFLFFKVRLPLPSLLLFHFGTQISIYCPVDGERVFPSDGRNRNMANVTDIKPEIKYEKKTISQEQMQHEYDYFLAQQILESMLKNNLITVDEFNQITALNRQSFSPALAQIMPGNR